MTGKTYAESSSEQDFTVRDQNDAPIFVVAGGASAAVLDRYAGRTVVATDGVFADDGVDLTALGGGGGGGGTPSTFYSTPPTVTVSGLATHLTEANLKLVTPNDPAQTGTDFTFAAGVLTINTTGTYHLALWAGIGVGAPATDYLQAYFVHNDESSGPLYYMLLAMRAVNAALITAGNQLQFYGGSITVRLTSADTISLNTGVNFAGTGQAAINAFIAGPL